MFFLDYDKDLPTVCAYRLLLTVYCLEYDFVFHSVWCFLCPNNLVKNLKDY